MRGPNALRGVRLGAAWAKALPDTLLRSGLVAFIVDKARLSFAKGEDRERFLDIVMERRDEIPALDLRLRYRQGGLLTNARAEPSDVEDYDHLAGFAYCDVAFADKWTRDALKRGGCAKLPRANASFERWLRDEV